MERLTGRNKSGQAYYKKCFEEPCQGMPEDCALCDYHNEMVCERLAAYEDTNLIPEKIIEIDKAFYEKCQEVNRLNAELAELQKQPQGDLISRSELIKELHYMIEGDADLRKDYEYLGIDDCIMSMPAAYDVNAVVEQIMVLHDEGYCPNEDSLECVLNKACSDCYREKVFDIVRNGGKE